MTPGIVLVGPMLRLNTWRTVWPARELARRGYPVRYVVPTNDPDHDPAAKIAEGDVVCILASNQDTGLAGTVRWLQGVVRPFKKVAKEVWVQFDDDYTAAADIQDLTERAREHAEQWSYYGRTWFDDLMADLKIACEEADGIIAATPEVADAYRPWVTGAVRVHHNWIPRWVTELKVRQSRKRCAGWFGTLAAHQRDIEWLAQGGRISRVGVVGEHEQFEAVIGYPLAWHHDTVTEDQRELYRLLGRFTVGLAPVVDDRWNRAKSWIKAVEFGAVGVPTICSNVAPYQQVRHAGLPVLTAASPLAMVSLANTYLEQGTDGWGEASRQAVRDHFTIEGRGGDEWAEWAEKVLA